MGINYLFEGFFLVEVYHYYYANIHTLRTSLYFQIIFRLFSPFEMKWMITDAVAIIPYELLAFMIKDKEMRISVFYYLRLLHLIRIARMFFLLSDEKTKIVRRYVQVTPFLVTIMSLTYQ